MDNYKENLNEIWKDHPDFIGLYKASNLGRIRSFYKYGGAAHGSFNGIIKPKINKRGYYSFKPSKDKIQKDWAVHRFIAQTFLSNPDELYTVNHKNGIKTDNRVENLEWASQTDQIRHAVDLGLRKSGENHRWASISKDLAQNIINEYKPHIFSQNYLAKKYGLSRGLVCAILTGKSWKKLNRTNLMGIQFSRHGKPTKLNIEQIEQIKNLYNSGSHTKIELAKQFNVTRQLIYRVLN